MNKDCSSHNNKPDKQRALVLQGGGALGAYECGVLKGLCTKLAEKDKQEDKEDRSLFDIVARTCLQWIASWSEFLSTYNAISYCKWHYDFLDASGTGLTSCKTSFKNSLVVNEADCLKIFIIVYLAALKRKDFEVMLDICLTIHFFEYCLLFSI